MASCTSAWVKLYPDVPSATMRPMAAAGCRAPVTATGEAPSVAVSGSRPKSRPRTAAARSARRDSAGSPARRWLITSRTVGGMTVPATSDSSPRADRSSLAISTTKNGLPSARVTT